jgi:hypothetical protein
VLTIVVVTGLFGSVGSVITISWLPGVSGFKRATQPCAADRPDPPGVGSRSLGSRGLNVAEEPGVSGVERMDAPRRSLPTLWPQSGHRAQLQPEFHRAMVPWAALEPGRWRCGSVRSRTVRSCSTVHGGAESRPSESHLRTTGGETLQAAAACRTEKTEPFSICLRRLTTRTLARATRLLAVLEEVVVDGLEVIRLLGCHAHVVANHEPRQLCAVDQHQPHRHLVSEQSRPAAESASCDEDSSARLRTLQRAHKRLHLGALNGGPSLISFGLDSDEVQP